MTSVQPHHRTKWLLGATLFACAWMSLGALIVVAYPRLYTFWLLRLAAEAESEHDFARKCELVEMVVRLQPRADNRRLLALSYVDRAMQLERAARIVNAKSAYDQAVAANPSSSEPYVAYARFLLSIGETCRAEFLLERGEAWSKPTGDGDQLARKYQDVYDEFARVQYRDGNISDSVSTFAKGHAGNGNSEWARLDDAAKIAQFARTVQVEEDAIPIDVRQEVLRISDEFPGGVQEHPRGQDPGQKGLDRR